jgi:hypothetical protein
VEPSAEKKEEENRQQPQKKQEGSGEQQQDVVDYHTMTASSSSRAAATTNTAAIGEQRSRESKTRTLQPPPISLFNPHEYFQPVFDEVDNLNKMLDSFIEEEKMIRREREKEEMTTINNAAGESDGGQWQRSSDNFETYKNCCQVKACLSQLL